MIQYNFWTQGIKSCITEYQNSNLEATSAFDLQSHKKKDTKIRDGIPHLVSLSAIRKARLINNMCTEKIIYFNCHCLCPYILCHIKFLKFHANLLVLVQGSVDKTVRERGTKRCTLILMQLC
jgi:hypothetical protein